MKRWAYFVLAVLAVAWLSGKGVSGTDVAKLQPVQVVWVKAEEELIVVTADSGDQGSGTDLHSAIQDLKDSAPAEVFLDTAEYLLIAEHCTGLLPQLMDYLRPSCMVCRTEGEPDFSLVSQFLQIHQPDSTLQKYRVGITELPILKTTEGRMELVP